MVRFLQNTSIMPLQPSIHTISPPGYTTFFPSTTDYDLKNSPLSWSKVPAMRHAMTLYPSSTYFWYLDPTALIMNRSLSLTGHIMDKERLESLMIVNEPVVPPDSVIKTFDHIKGDRIDLVVAQDSDGLCQSSFIIRRGEWAKYFLDAWFNPLYRSYNFQKAEGHALEHIVQYVNSFRRVSQIVKVFLWFGISLRSMCFPPLFHFLT